MQFSPVSDLRSFCLLAIAALSVSAQPGAPNEIQGLPPRAAASEYSGQGKAGGVTIGADFTGHSVPTMQGPLTSEDYVAVEVAFFASGQPKATLSFEDFSIRINGKKTTIASVQYGLVMKSLSDPEWIPPVVEGGEKSKGGISGGGAAGSDPKPLPPKMPFPLRRAMEQRAQKSALPEGERVLPVAGLVFFPYRGKDQSIETVELYYSGAAGKATLTLRR